MTDKDEKKIPTRASHDQLAREAEEWDTGKRSPKGWVDAPEALPLIPSGCSMTWKAVERPGYFGRQRDRRIAAYNDKYGEGRWRLVWMMGPLEELALDFPVACKYCYERSYLEWLKNRPEDIDFICSYGECIDNAPTNVLSGLDYSKQESFSTHIQDIAIRNVLAILGRKFEGPKDKILIIRSRDSEGYKFGPGNVPFFNPDWIAQPSLCPKWANKGSVEDFWQSNKWIQRLIT